MTTFVVHGAIGTIQAEATDGMTYAVKNGGFQYTPSACNGTYCVRGGITP